jgi:lipopolysaccharide transport system ATP-binding protein
MNTKTTTKAPLTDMPDDVVLSVRNVSKKFCRNLKRSMNYGIKDLAYNLVGAAQDTSQTRRDEFWALKDVSFDLKRGESLGIIGANGSGKSTLFRVIHGIYPPDLGEVHMRGRAGALIALGAGFHPHMTGRENVFLNGTILGISVEEIRERLEEIIEFSELGDFIDAPVSTYSSGMYVRLGFSVAVHMHPDILIIDEVLAVGDVTFQNKCARFLRKLLTEDRTILFVSHNMASVRKICSRVVYLDKGVVVADGTPEHSIGQFLQKSSAKVLKNIIVEEGDTLSPTPTYESEIATIVSAATHNADNEVVQQVLYRDEVTFELELDISRTIETVVIELLFYEPTAGCIAARTRQFTYVGPVGVGHHHARINCQSIPLAPGTYTIHATLFDENTVLSMIENITILAVAPRGSGIMHNIGGFFEVDGEMAISAAKELVTENQSHASS